MRIAVTQKKRLWHKCMQSPMKLQLDLIFGNKKKKKLLLQLHNPTEQL